MSSVTPFLPVSTTAFPLSQKTSSTVELTPETAREFEATLLGMLLKEMRQSMEPDGGLFPGDSGDIQGGLFDLYMGRYLADAGGIGMAPALERQLRSSYAHAAESGRPSTRAGGPTTR